MTLDTILLILFIYLYVWVRESECATESSMRISAKG